MNKAEGDKVYLSTLLQMTSSIRTYFISRSTEGPDEYTQQRDLMKTFIPSTAQGPEEDNHFNQ